MLLRGRTLFGTCFLCRCNTLCLVLCASFWIAGSSSWFALAVACSWVLYFPKTHSPQNRSSPKKSSAPEFNPKHVIDVSSLWDKWSFSTVRSDPLHFQYVEKLFACHSQRFCQTHQICEARRARCENRSGDTLGLLTVLWKTQHLQGRPQPRAIRQVVTQRGLSEVSLLLVPLLKCFINVRLECGLPTLSTSPGESLAQWGWLLLIRSETFGFNVNVRTASPSGMFTASPQDPKLGMLIFGYFW